MSRKPLTSKVEKAVLKRDRHRCANPTCLFHFIKPSGKAIHHINDESTHHKKWWVDQPQNLVTLCSTRRVLFFFKVKGCHQKYHAWIGGTQKKTNLRTLQGFYALFSAKRFFTICVIIIFATLSIKFF